MIIILLGSPGSGKGTQAKILSQRFGLTHLATGDIFRSEIAAKTALGLKAADYVKSGNLVPDAIVTEMVAGRMDSENGRYLLDGFPRTLEQAQDLTKMLTLEKKGVSLVVYLNLSRQEALKRLTARRTCTKCGEVFNVVTRPPKVAGVCDSCGSKIEQRQDDSEATAPKRLMIFEDLTQPLISYYRSEGVFEEVDASQPVDTVTEGLSALIEKAAKVGSGK